MGNDINHKNSEKILIANACELGEGESMSFEFQTGTQKRRGFLVMQNGQVYGYLNRCPHTGVNLEWQANQFLDRSEQYIQCSTHGARFKIQDGLCIYGPCQGRTLQALKIERNDNSIYLVTEKEKTEVNPS